MKILIYSPSFYPNIGGIELLTLNLAKEFKVLDIDVVVLTQASPNGEDVEVNIVYHPTLNDFIKYYNWCDVLYMPNLSLKICWLFLLNPFKKWVVSHNTWYFDPEHPNYVVALLKQLFLYKATNISVSRILAKSILPKSFVIHNSYNNKLFINAHLERKKDFLFVGRLVSSKGCVDLVNAFKILLKTHPSATLTIVGVGPEKIFLENTVDKFGLEKSIYFLGAKSQEELVTILNMHKCLVVPSIGSEAFGIVVLEALACGCIVLTSDSTGLIEAGDKFSIKFPIGNINDMANEMKLILNPSYANHFENDELSDFLKCHTIEVVAKQYLSHFS